MNLCGCLFGAEFMYKRSNTVIAELSTPSTQIETGEATFERRFFFLDLCISIIHFYTHICHCPLCFILLRNVIQKLQQLPRQRDFLHLFTCGQPQGEISAGSRFEEQNPVFDVLCGPLACLVVVIQNDQLHRPADKIKTNTEREREELRGRSSCRLVRRSTDF